MSHALGALALSCQLAACGIAGRPRPPTPLAPKAPTQVKIRSTPEGLEIFVPSPDGDVEGGALTAPLLAHAYLSADARCEGPAVWRGPVDQWARWAGAQATGRVQVRVSHGAQLGPPGAPVDLRRVAAPPAPDAPLVLATADGKVEITWLPPEGVTHMRVLRDGVIVAELPAESATMTDQPPPGRHQYVLQGIGPSAVTALSAGVKVRVRRLTRPSPRPPR